MEFFVIMIVIGAVIYFISGGKQAQQKGYTNSDNTPWMEVSDKESVMNKLNDIPNFDADKTIISKQGSFAFGIDETKRKIAFITNDLATFVVNYNNISSYQIVVNRRSNNEDITYNTKITLMIKRTNGNTPVINIDFFDANKLINRVYSPIKNQLLLKSIYMDELNQAELIGNILSDIVKSNGRATPPPTPKTESQPKVQVKPHKPIVAEVAQTETRKNAKINIPDTPEIEIKDYSEVYNAAAPTKMAEEEPVTSMEGKTQINIAELENLTRGIFISSELLSIINDARMKGKNDIYINTKELNTLRQGVATESPNSQHKDYSTVQYQPISYQSEYYTEEESKKE